MYPQWFDPAECQTHSSCVYTMYHSNLGDTITLLFRNCFLLFELSSSEGLACALTYISQKHLHLISALMNNIIGSIREGLIMPADSEKSD